MASDRYQPRSFTHDLNIASLSDVYEWGWTGYDLLESLITDIDLRTLPALTEKAEGTPEQWVPVFVNHPDTWRLLIAGPKQIVGYWHFVPLLDDMYDFAKRGELSDSDITCNRMAPYGLSKISWGL